MSFLKMQHRWAFHIFLPQPQLQVGGLLRFAMLILFDKTVGSMQEQWRKVADKLDNIERLLLQIVRQGAEKDVGDGDTALLTLKQAAEFLHLSTSSIYKLIYKKNITPVQRTAKSRILFTKEHLINYLKQKTATKNRTIWRLSKNPIRKAG